jgi:hypothetical protein
VLTGVMAASEEQWASLVLEKKLATQLATMLAVSTGGLRINLLAALTSAAQGGDPGAQAVCDAGTNSRTALYLIDPFFYTSSTSLAHHHPPPPPPSPPPLSGLGPIMEACGPSESPQVQEAAADLVCQLATCEACRGTLAASGAVERMIGLLSISSDEIRWEGRQWRGCSQAGAKSAGSPLVKPSRSSLLSPPSGCRVRALMALGMLLPNSIENQRVLAQNTAAIRLLMVRWQRKRSPGAQGSSFVPALVLLLPSPSCNCLDRSS